MSTALWPFLLGKPYSEGFVHTTARAEMGGGRLITSPLHASVGRFRASGALLLPQTGGTFDTLAAFVAARQGGYDTFLYLPALTVHGRSTSEAVGTGDGGTTLFPLDYKYPKTGTFTVTVAGVAKTEGADWDLADSGGGSFSLGENPYIKFTYGTPTLGQAIVATYSFYVPVRLDNDDLMAAAGVLSHASTSAASVVGVSPVVMVQDYPGSHLVTVPTP